MSGEVEIGVPDGITANLTRECTGNVPDRHVVDVTCGLLRKMTWGPICTRGYMVTRLNQL
jgi:hypothetical protein